MAFQVDKRFIRTTITLFQGQIEIRTRIIDELVSSELTYLSLLRDIDQHWIKPLSEILSKEDMKAVFINLMKIKEIHENFYKDIKRESEKQFESRKISGKKSHYSRIHPIFRMLPENDVESA